MKHIKSKHTRKNNTRKNTTRRVNRNQTNRNQTNRNQTASKTNVKKRNTMKKRTRSNKSSEFKKLQCSPFVGNGEFSCYDTASLIKLKSLWNKENINDKIHTTQPYQIWSSLKTKMENQCPHEKCWLRKISSTTQIPQSLYASFAPSQPSVWKQNPNTWLNSDDITKVLRQYEMKYSCFEYIGPSPIDYDVKLEDTSTCVWEELCKFDLASLLKRGKTKMGIVFNLDTHKGPGTHWVGLFVNAKTGNIYYFDSTGHGAPSRIRKLVRTIRTQGKDLQTTEPIDFKFHENTKVHQYKNTECGVYVLHFIVHMLIRPNQWNVYKTKTLHDNSVSKYRSIFFNKSGL